MSMAKKLIFSKEKNDVLAPASFEYCLIEKKAVIPGIQQPIQLAVLHGLFPEKSNIK